MVPEFDVPVPDAIPLPKKPHYLLWTGIAVFVSLWVTVIAFIFFPVPWLKDSTFIVTIFFFTFSLVMAFRVHIYDKKKFFAIAWNASRDKYIQELLGIRCRELPVTEWVILTPRGEHGNAQIAWQKDNQLPIFEAKGEVFKETQIMSMSDINNDDRHRYCVLLELLLYASTNIATLPTVSECVIVVNEANQANQVIREDLLNLCQQHGLNADVFKVVSSASGDEIVQAWTRDRQSSACLFIVLNISEQDNSSEVALLFLFSDRRPNFPSIHQAVEYQGHASVFQTLRYGNIEAQNIEAIWCSGVNDFLRSRVLMALKAHAPDTEPRIINIDEVFGYSADSAEWFAAALASEWAATSLEPQLILTHNGKTLIRVIQPFDIRSMS